MHPTRVSVGLCGFSATPRVMRVCVRRCRSVRRYTLALAVSSLSRSLARILRDQLHWLRPGFVKLAVTVHQCLNGRAPPYLSWSTASRYPVLTRAGICVPPTVIYLPYRVSGSTLTAVGRSQLLARWPGTHSRILSAIQRAAQTVLGVKRTCSRVTSASSALGVLNDCALYKSTHSRTHSLIARLCAGD